MNFTLLRSLAWIGFYLLIIETGLEVRAYYRGVDTLLFGNFRRAESGTAMAEKASDLTAVGLGRTHSRLECFACGLLLHRMQKIAI